MSSHHFPLHISSFQAKKHLTEREREREKTANIRVFVVLCMVEAITWNFKLTLIIMTATTIRLEFHFKTSQSPVSQLTALLHIAILTLRLTAFVQKFCFDQIQAKAKFFCFLISISIVNDKRNIKCCWLLVLLCFILR